MFPIGGVALAGVGWGCLDGPMFAVFRTKEEWWGCLGCSRAALAMFQHEGIALGGVAVPGGPCLQCLPQKKIALVG